MSDWSEVTAGEIMHTPVKAVVAGSTLSDVMELLTDERITGAVVTTGGGRPVGVISQSDIVAHLAGLERDGRGGGSDGWDLRTRRELPEPERTLVEAVMTPELVTVEASARLPEVCRTLVERGVHRVLVVEDGPVVGIVSTTDLVRAMDAAWRTRSRARRTTAKAAKTTKKKRPARSSAAQKRTDAKKKKTTRAR